MADLGTLKVDVTGDVGPLKASLKDGISQIRSFTREIKKIRKAADAIGIGLILRDIVGDFKDQLAAISAEIDTFNKSLGFTDKGPVERFADSLVSGFAGVDLDKLRSTMSELQKADAVGKAAVKAENGLKGEIIALEQGTEAGLRHKLAAEGFNKVMIDSQIQLMKKRDALAEVKKAREADEKTIYDTIKALEKANEAALAGPDETMRRQLRAAGATKEQLQDLEHQLRLKKKIAEMEEEKRKAAEQIKQIERENNDLAKEQQKLQEKLADDALAAIEGLKSPLQKWQDEIARLSHLHSQGLLTDEQFTQAGMQAGQGVNQQQFAGAVTGGSAEAFSAINRFQAGQAQTTEREKMLKEMLAQKEEQKKANRLLDRLVQIQENGVMAVGF